MTAFSCKIPNGKYIAKLYFAETYARITGPGQRVFSFNVQGHEIKDFDIWAKAGGPQRAYIETVQVEVTDGEFRIAFTRDVENPAINAIEIIPQAEDPRRCGGVRSDHPDQGWPVHAVYGFERSGLESRMKVLREAIRRDNPDVRRFGPAASEVLAVVPAASVVVRGGSGAAYASAIAVDFDGQRQYVQLTSNALIGVAASDGKFLWRYDRPANAMGINCSTPIAQDGLVFAASAYGAAGGGEAEQGRQRRCQGRGSLFHDEDAEPPRRHDRLRRLPVRRQRRQRGRHAHLSRLPDRRLLWRDREAPKGSLALADGRLYLRTEDGAMLLIEPNREQYVQHGRFEQPDRTRSPAWTYPVIANGKLYIRDQDLLLCYDVKDPSQK